MDPSTADTAYIAAETSLRSGTAIYRTSNGGSSWQDITANLPPIGYHSIVVDPVTPVHVLYLGSDFGCFMSTDGGLSWQPINNGLPNVAVSHLVLNSYTGYLHAATYGRGVFRAAVRTRYTLTTSISPSGAFTISTYPASPDGTYAAGMQVCLTALASSAGQFVWSGDPLDSSGCLIMDGNKSVAASLSTGQPNIPSITSVANSTGYQATLAPGSVFGVFGSNLGAENIVVAQAPNYPTTLAGSSVTFAPVGGGAVITARLFYSLNIAVAGLLPSTIPSGTYQVRLTYNGLTSAPMNVTIVTRNFGIATVDGTGRGPAQATNGNVNGGISLVRFTSGSVSFDGLNWALGPAHPGDTLVLWGTGGGPDILNDTGGSSGDQTQDGNFFVNVGGFQVRPEYAGTSVGYPGLFQINFTLPQGIAPSCFTSVQVSSNYPPSGIALSNQVTIAIAATGQNSCPNPPN